MKETNIIPVPEIKLPKTNSDFRPLSIQSSLSKIFEIIGEKHVRKRLFKLWKQDNEN